MLHARLSQTAAEGSEFPSASDDRRLVERPDHLRGFTGSAARVAERVHTSGDHFAGALTGAVTGAASLNVLKTGDSMTGALKVSSNTTAGYSMRFIGAFLTPPTSGNLEGDLGWDVTHHSMAISTATKASDASGWVYSLSSAGSVWTSY